MKKVRIQDLTPLCLALCLASPASAQQASTFTDDLWARNRDVYAAILAHPFLTGLQDGTLDRRAFSFYLMQDVSYLRAFADALRAIAPKAPKAEWRALLEQHAAESVSAELQLHQSVFKDYGIPAEEVARMEPAPEAYAYETFMLATAHTQTFGEAMAALLPCYWIYAEVGKTLKARGSKDPVYQRWIDNYASPGYDRTVQAVLVIVNEVAATATPDVRARMHANFRRASRYEWMFWDSAYHRRGWPP